MILGLRSYFHADAAAVHRDTVGAALGSTEWPDAKSWLRPELTGDPLGNDEWGNCVEAGMMRQLQCWRLHAQGDAWCPTRADALELYRLISGCDAAQDAAPGPGTRLDDAERYWARTGLSTSAERFRTAVAVVVPPQDLDAIDRAIAALGGVGLCWDLPEYADGAAEWSWPGSPSPIAGMHFTTAVAYDRTMPDGAAGRYTVLSWGLAVAVSAAFVRQYLASAAAWISPDWFGTDGRSPAGLTASQASTMAALSA